MAVSGYLDAENEELRLKKMTQGAWPPGKRSSLDRLFPPAADIMNAAR